MLEISAIAIEVKSYEFF